MYMYIIYIYIYIYIYICIYIYIYIYIYYTQTAIQLFKTPGFLAPTLAFVGSIAVTNAGFSSTKLLLSLL